MKFSHFYKKVVLRFLCVLLILVLSKITNANVNDDVKKITSKLRCMTCQNQTIYSSDADFSLSIKKIVKEKLTNNYTEKEIVDFLTERYGEYIIFEPKMNKQNLFLWLFPFIILAVSLVFLTIRIRKNT